MRRQQLVRSLLPLGMLAALGPLRPSPASADRPASDTDPGPLLREIEDEEARAFLQVLGRPDGEDMLYRISGSVYADVPGDALAPGLRHGAKLFGLEGFNIRRLHRVPGTDQIHLLTRELVFYTDPDDHESVLQRWTNPLDGRSYPVVPVNNDAVNQGPFTVTPGFRAAPAQSVGEELVWTMDIPPNHPIGERLGDDFGLEGGVYTTWELFDFYVDRAELRRRTAPGLIPSGAMRVKNSWTRIGPWLPFMGISEAAARGRLAYHARSWTLDSFGELEEWIKLEVREHYPLFETSPAEPGPNQTSWTSFWAKQLHEGAITWEEWIAANGQSEV